MKTATMRVAAAFMIFAACEGNHSSPTQPELPRVSTVTANYHLTLGVESGGPPEAVQVLADGVVIYFGPPLGGGPGDYYGYYCCEPLYVSGDLGIIALEEGRHTLSFRVISQAVSPTTYRVTGHVEAVHKVNGRNVDSQGASWDEPVTLTTGDAWTGVFEIRAWRS